MGSRVRQRERRGREVQAPADPASWRILSTGVGTAELSHHIGRVIPSLKTIFKFLAFLATVVVFGSTSGWGAVEPGQQAPDFKLADLGGQLHQLAAYKGRIVVLEWTNPECPFVQKHYGSGNIPRLQKSAVAAGVVWLTINSGHPGAEGDYDAPQAAAWLTQMGATPTAYLRDQEGRVGRLYGAKTSPHIFVITADGKLAYEGAIDSIRSADVDDISRATNYVAAALAAVKAGKPMNPAATQPYGCSVKY